MGVLRKSAFEKKKPTPNVDEQQTPPSPLVQRRHSTSTAQSHYYSRGGDSMVTGNRERKSSDRSRSLDEGHRELKKRQPRRSNSDNITKTQRVVNMPSVADDEDDESTETGCHLGWILGYEWIQGIVTAIEGLPFLPDGCSSKEKGPAESEFGPNDTSVLGYRVATSGTLQFRKIRPRG